MTQWILCGLPRIGKTTVGTLLASKLGQRFIDTDRLIEGAHKKLQESHMAAKEIHVAFGDTYFRLLESNVIAALEQAQKGVVSTGGGALLKPENRERIKKLGTVIYLKGSIDTLLERMKTGGLPTFIDKEHPRESLEKLIKEREQDYLALAAKTVVTDGLTPDQVVEAILSDNGLSK